MRLDDNADWSTDIRLMEALVEQLINADLRACRSPFSSERRLRGPVGCCTAEQSQSGRVGVTSVGVGCYVKRKGFAGHDLEQNGDVGLNLHMHV